jgi:glycosyltransferase involved in cell wall biosynthesis
MRFHALGLPHTITSPEYSACAYTQKVLKFCRMMTRAGHEVIHYGHQRSQVEATEHITVITDQDLAQAYGDYDWRRNFFKFAVDDHAHRTFHARAIEEIGRRKQPCDFVLHFWGWGHRPIALAHPDLINMEPGIGYRDTFARWRVFESHAIRNASQGPNSISTCDQDWYSVVIPNYFDIQDFDYSEHKQDYILYLGRVYAGKGVDIAIEATERAGRRLIIAGQGSLKDMGYSQTPAHVTELGYADPLLRRQLLRDAQALFIASRYNEPFGGVQVEAYLSGTPVISPDWGAFAEYNHDNITGFRCRTFQEFVQAIDTVQYLNPIQCRKHGEQFALDQIAPRYERYCQSVLDVYTGDGWYQTGSAQ